MSALHGKHSRKMVCLSGIIYASKDAARLALKVSQGKLEKLIFDEAARESRRAWPAWMPGPLSEERQKRLEGWARTLPGMKHIPWRSEATQAREAAASRDRREE